MSQSFARSLAVRFLALLAFCACTALAASLPAAAQTIRDKSITDNPSRTPGGSCIYGGDGKLLHAPRGVRCPATEADEPPPASIPPERAESAKKPTPTQPPASLAPHTEKKNAATRVKISELLAEREHLDVELARVREALSYEDREAARDAVEESLGKISQHLEHEARVLHELSAK